MIFTLLAFLLSQLASLPDKTVVELQMIIFVVATGRYGILILIVYSKDGERGEGASNCAGEEGLAGSAFQLQALLHHQKRY